jgi:uncharacterized protein (TIRG00374 family)
MGALPWIGATCLFVLSNLLGAAQWGELLRVQEITLPRRTLVSLYFVGVFFNNFLVSNIGGDAVRVYDLRRLTGKGSPGFAATFLDRFIGLFVLILFSVVALLADPGLLTPAIGAAVGVLAAALAGILCFGFSRRLSSLVMGPAERWIPRRAAAMLADIRDAFMLYRRAYAMLARVAGIAALVQLCRIAVYFTVARGMGLDLGFEPFVVFIPLIAIVAAVPVSFGGIGVREHLGAVLFGRVGVAPAAALAMMFLGYLSGIVGSLPGGIAFVAGRARPSTGPGEG